MRSPIWHIDHLFISVVPSGRVFPPGCAVLLLRPTPLVHHGVTVPRTCSVVHVYIIFATLVGQGALPVMRVLITVIGFTVSWM